MTAPAARDPYLDNAKFLLVVLVVVGHNWAMLQDMRAVKAAYTVLYAFHMPAFVLLCGYFSRGFTGRPEQIRRLAAGVLLPYLVFETAYSGLYSLVHGGPFAVTPTTPSYLCWFLLALFVWRLTAPLWRAVRRPVLVAVAISLAAGCTTIGDELALSRVLQFLPWFVLGLQMEPEHFQSLRGASVRRFGLAAALTCAATAWWLAPRMDSALLLMRYGHAELHMSLPGYLAMRLVLFAAGAALVVAFFSWVPRHPALFTAAGAATMYPYLLHGLVVRTAEGYGVYRVVAWGGLPGAALLTLAAVALAVALCSPPVRRLTRLLVEPGRRRAPVVLSADQVTGSAEGRRCGG